MDKAKVYLYDGSFDGLLTTLAYCVKNKKVVQAIVAEKQLVPNLFDEKIYHITDEDQAQRLAHYLKTLGHSVFKLVVNNYLSEDAESGFHLFVFIKLSLVHGRSVQHNVTDDSVAFVLKKAQQVSHEAHRVLGFLRFKQLKNDLLYAPIEPDFNVIGYCVDHFSKRLKNKEWIIHDVRRDIALYWNRTELKHIEIEREFTEYVSKYGTVEKSHLDADEVSFQKLWQVFHSAIANEGRKNEKLQRQLMPARYWKYLTEMK